ncbi:MAG: hypothetical protein RL095_52 [Verrucomicrobiota bacterium]
MTEPIDRRPVASRSWGPIAALAALCARLGISPNAISVGSLVFAVLSGLSFACTSQVEAGSVLSRLLWIGGGLALGGRALCNVIDGLVAGLRPDLKRPDGELYNEVPDRLSDAVFLIGLGHAAGSSVELGWAAALAAVLTAYCRVQGGLSLLKARPELHASFRQDFSGVFSKPRRMGYTFAFAALMSAWPQLAATGLPSGLAFCGGVTGVFLLLIALGSAATCAGRLIRCRRELFRS